MVLTWYDMLSWFLHILLQWRLLLHFVAAWAAIVSTFGQLISNFFWKVIIVLFFFISWLRWNVVAHTTPFECILVWLKFILLEVARLVLTRILGNSWVILAFALLLDEHLLILLLQKLNLILDLLHALVNLRLGTLVYLPKLVCLYSWCRGSIFICRLILRLL